MEKSLILPILAMAQGSGGEGLAPSAVGLIWLVAGLAAATVIFLLFIVKTNK